MNHQDIPYSPGLEAFAERLIEDLRAGRCIVLLMPDRGASSLLNALRRRIQEEEIFDWNQLDASGPAPLETLFAEYAVDHRPGDVKNLEALYADMGFQGRTLELEVDEESWSPWKAFLEDLAVHNENVPMLERTQCVAPLLGALTEHPPKESSLLAVHKWDGVLGKQDMFYAAYSAVQRLNRRPYPQLAKELAATIIVELAKWDYSLVYALAAEPLELLCDPLSRLRAIAEHKEFSPEDASLDADDHEALWRRGLGQTFHGEWEEHSCFLAVKDDHDAVRRRIWIAQVRVLFPYIELQRQKILDRFCTSLRLPVPDGNGNWIHDVRELELAHICYQFSSRAVRVESDVYFYVQSLRKARNLLAHAEALDGEMIHSGLLESAPWE